MANYKYDLYDLKGNLVSSNIEQREVTELIGVKLPASFYARNKNKLNKNWIILFHGDILDLKEFEERRGKNKKGKIRVDKKNVFEPEIISEFSSMTNKQKAEWLRITKLFKNVIWVKENGKRLQVH